MRFMMLIKANPDYEAGLPPSQELMAGMAKLTEENVKSGALISVGGLAPSSKAMRIRHAGGKRTVIDGPFAETKELIGGYAVIEAETPAEALQHAQQVVDVHANAGVADFEIEIRLISHEISFGPTRD
jgi:hypothetical protein